MHSGARRHKAFCLICVHLRPSAAKNSLFMTRRLPIGAELTSDGAQFRVWAAKRCKVEVVLESGEATQLQREPSGYFSGIVAEAHKDSLYRYHLDGDGPF